MFVFFFPLSRYLPCLLHFIILFSHFTFGGRRQIYASSLYPGVIRLFFDAGDELLHLILSQRLLLESLSVFPCFFVDNPKVNFIINLSIGLINPTNGILFLDSSSYRTSNVNRLNRSRIKRHTELNNTVFTFYVQF